MNGDPVTMAGRAVCLSKRISGAWLNMRNGLNSSPLVGTRTTVRIVGCSIGMRTILLGMRTGINAGGELMASCFVTLLEFVSKTWNSEQCQRLHNQIKHPKTASRQTRGSRLA